MDPSLAAVPQLVALLLGFTLTAQAFDELDYCRPPKICPNFTRISTNQKYEERLYEPSVWMCTEEEGTDSIAVTKASIQLINFMEFHSWAQVIEINPNTWPSLVSVEQVKGGQVFSLCWMVPPGVTLFSHGTVTVTTLPRTTMFVRSFGGVPTFESGQWHMQELKKDLISDGKHFDPNVFYGASYEFFIAPTQHNEILVPKA